MSDSLPPDPERRTMLGAASSLAMAGGLVAGYGTFFAFAGRFLYPSARTDKGWMFVTDTKAMTVGDSRTFRTPAGASVVITRRGVGETARDFLALSSTCPHLGCQVHWEAHNDRFFCPCHNGVFDPAGKATGGPPADAGQSLPEYPLRVEKGMLFIEVPMKQVVAEGRPGHDPCLRPRGAV